MNTKNRFYEDLKPFLKCKDFTVSGETYEVKLNPEYDMLVTSPVPFNLESYY